MVITYILYLISFRAINSGLELTIMATSLSKTSELGFTICMLLSLASSEIINTRQILQSSLVISNSLSIISSKIKPNRSFYLILSVNLGSKMRLDVMIFDPPRQGPTLWEIGFPDRTAAEFYVPDPYPTLMNKLYNNHPDKLLLLLCSFQSHFPCLNQRLSFLMMLENLVLTNRFRQYGLWERYAAMYPDNDLVYTVGVDDCSKDWFYAHVNR